MEFPSWLAPFQPLVPLKSLVEEINSIYHAFDAKNYDAEHLETRLLWPELWAEMIHKLPERNSWRVLDFGCGTGFEAAQLLHTVGSPIDVLVAHDPSREMLAQGRRRLRDHSNVIFSDNLATVRGGAPYDLLITNSVLHHLPDIEETVYTLQSYLSDDAYWLAGHEPSARFYKNPECVHLFEKYAGYQQRIKWFRPASYAAKLSKILGRHTLRTSARTAFERGLFAKLPSDTVIARLVDFHVHHLLDDVNASRGLDLEKMQSIFKPHWTVLWSKTYSYLGAFSELRAPRRWLDKARLLKEQFPADGANFCSVWRRSFKNS
jgi:SAM-dependent methyltransferase